MLAYIEWDFKDHLYLQHMRGRITVTEYSYEMHLLMIRRIRSDRMYRMFVAHALGYPLCKSQMKRQQSYITVIVSDKTVFKSKQQLLQYEPTKYCL